MENIEAKVIEIICDELAVDENEVTPNADLSIDLGADSLDHVELVMRIKEEFEIAISDEELESIKSVRDLIEVAERLVSAKGSAA